jgi:hypothetical protein
MNLEVIHFRCTHIVLEVGTCGYQKQAQKSVSAEIVALTAASRHSPSVPLVFLTRGQDFRFT